MDCKLVMQMSSTSPFSLSHPHGAISVPASFAGSACHLRTSGGLRQETSRSSFLSWVRRKRLGEPELDPQDPHNKPSMVECACNSCSGKAETGRYLEAHWSARLGKLVSPRFRDLVSKVRSDGGRYPTADFWALHAYVCTHEHEHIHTTHACTYLWVQKGNKRKCFSVLCSPPLEASKRPRSQQHSSICKKRSPSPAIIPFDILIHIPAGCLARGFSLGTVLKIFFKPVTNRFSAVCNQI